MDQKEIEVINKNMVQLIKETDPNTVFLTELESQGVLGDSDMDKLVSNFCQFFTPLWKRK